MKKIGVEEHFSTKATLEHFRPPIIMSDEETGGEAKPQGDGGLLPNTEARLRDMDEAGIDMQVLSLGPGIEQLEVSLGTSLAVKTNDELAEVVKQYPDRFAGLASLAPLDPATAADELERAVVKLGLKGAMIKSHINGEYLDDPKYWPIFERAEKLGVPIYIHPREPSPDMIKPYLAYPEVAGAMWGFAAEVGLHAVRLICSGVFDKYPSLKIILGHMGEALPFWMWRLDSKGPQPGGRVKHNPSYYVKNNFFVSTSGMFSQPALICTYLALGADNILFAVDYAAESSVEAAEFIEAAPLCDADKEKISHINAEKLFKL